MGEYVFESCTKLTSINIPNSMTSINSLAFYGCTGINDITVSASNSTYKSENNSIIKKSSNELVLGCKTTDISQTTAIGIGEYAFGGCTGLTRINIPKKVTSIARNAFYACSELEEITVDEANTMFRSKGNAIIQKSYNRLYLGCKNTIISSDEDLDEIGHYAFYGCYGLESIIIPDSVTLINDYAFAGCTGLKTITMPSEMSNIGNWAFKDCINLTSVNVNNKLSIISEGAFSNCISLTNIKVPYYTEFILNDAFDMCKNLVSVTIDGQSIVKKLIDYNSCGNLISNANIVYIKENLIVTNAIYLLDNYEVVTSEIAGYIKYVSKE